MREAYRQWLNKQPFATNTRSTQSAQANRLETHYGDLDAAYDRDKFASLRASLEYTKDDERRKRPNPSKLQIDGDLYKNLASYRSTLSYFTRFRESEAASKSGASGAVQTLNLGALEALKQRFLARYPDFPELTFAADHGGYWDEERGYKEQVFSGLEDLLGVPQSDADLGRAVIRLLQQPPANFVGWRAFTVFKDVGGEAETTAVTAIGEMLADRDEPAVVAAACAAKIYPLMSGPGEESVYGHVRSVVTTVLALVRPDEAIAVKTRYMQRAALQLTGQRPLKTAVMTVAEYRDVLSLAEAIFKVMRDDWGWRPRDLWDVQGFLWVTSELFKEDPTPDEDSRPPKPVQPAIQTMMQPTNLILYGPPGTGKTYATAAKAVAICDGGEIPEGRAAVMARYRELVDSKRVSFVTFHQSYAYEDFVEGLRPETADEDAEGTGSAGFSLKPQAGVFRQIAELARNNRGKAVSTPKIDKTKQVFKMSLGRSAQEEGARLFREAIEGGYVVLGWGGEMDWSAPEYADFGAIKARWRQDHPDATGNDPNIQQLYALRGGMKTGDLVIVSDGNKKFRAIGEVTGPYQFIPGHLREYNHRRKVRWLWHDNQGQPRELIYGRGFSQVSTYQLDSEQINWAALEQIVAGGGEGVETTGDPDPFVLVIDEINRANVSKVFGELITLIEPDKRLRAINELTVTLPYSRETFGVPANLHIIWTMNTADRSIALLDTALRRRFEFEELIPDPSKLAEAGERTGVDLSAVLEGLNARIEYLFDREHQIGHGFFMPCRDQADLSRVMRTKVIPLLAEYFYENWEKVRQVLGETSDTGSFVSRTRLPPPRGAVGDYPNDDGRWRYTVGAAFPASAYEQLKP